MGDRPDATVEVVPYDDAWPEAFEATRARLAAAVGDVAIAIEHIGSTAVPGLAAKPTMPEIEEYRRFRDALRGDPALATEYEELKPALAAEHGSDRSRYVEAKSRWVDERLSSLPPAVPGAGGHVGSPDRWNQ